MYEAKRYDSNTALVAMPMQLILCSMYPGSFYTQLNVCIYFHYTARGRGCEEGEEGGGGHDGAG